MVSEISKVGLLKIKRIKEIMVYLQQIDFKKNLDRMNFFKSMS